MLHEIQFQHFPPRIPEKKVAAGEIENTIESKETERRCTTRAERLLPHRFASKATLTKRRERLKDRKHDSPVESNGETTLHKQRGASCQNTKCPKADRATRWFAN